MTFTPVMEGRLRGLKAVNGGGGELGAPRQEEVLRGSHLGGGRRNRLGGQG